MNTWVLQQFLTGLNKTQLINALRSLRQMYEKAYKTTARQLTFTEIMEALEIATKLTTDGKQPVENTMENKGQ